MELKIPGNYSKHQVNSTKLYADPQRGSPLYTLAHCGPPSFDLLPFAFSSTLSAAPFPILPARYPV